MWAKEHIRHRTEGVGRGLRQESLGYFLGGWADGWRGVDGDKSKSCVISISFSLN